MALRIFALIAECFEQGKLEARPESTTGFDCRSEHSLLAFMLCHAFSGAATYLTIIYSISCYSLYFDQQDLLLALADFETGNLRNFGR